METQRLPEGVELSYTDRAVHLMTNGALMAYLRQRGNGSLPLSRMILDRWMRAGEAHGHQDRRLYKTAKRLKNATAVIDMGERSVDANRWVFDLLAPGYGILCFLLGSRA